MFSSCFLRYILCKRLNILNAYFPVLFPCRPAFFRLLLPLFKCRA